MSSQSQQHISTLSSLFNDAASLEKILKLSQAISQMTAGLHPSHEEAVKWRTARAQLALSRRFFRLFKWVDCWMLAHAEYENGPLYPSLLPSSSNSTSASGKSSVSDYTAVSRGSEHQSWPTAGDIRSRLDDETNVTNDAGVGKKGEEGGAEAPTTAEHGRPKVEAKSKGGKANSPHGDEVHTMLAVLKWSLLGMYFFMEMWTITDTMALTSIWPRTGIDLQEEALKMWVYGIAASIVLGLYELFTLYYPIEGTTKLSKSDGAADEKSSRGESRVTGRASEATTPLIFPKQDKDGKPGQRSAPEKPAVFREEWKRIVKQLVVDCCDILVPASAVGWIGLDGVYVGLAGAMSAGTSLVGMWTKAASR